MIRALIERAAEALIWRTVLRRPPDFIVGGQDNPYLLRWWLIPRNPVLNVYLHRFLRDDDDSALHDHPWAWCSVLLNGSYIEHTIEAGGIHRRQLREAPSIKVSGPRRAHRVELLRPAGFTLNAPDRLACWTLFITGPRMREWGFHCPERGWVHWRDFTSPADSGQIGRGCDAANDNTQAQGTRRKGAA